MTGILLFKERIYLILFRNRKRTNGQSTAVCVCTWHACMHVCDGQGREGEDRRKWHWLRGQGLEHRGTIFFMLSPPPKGSCEPRVTTRYTINSGSQSNARHQYEGQTVSTLTEPKIQWKYSCKSIKHNGDIYNAEDMQFYFSFLRMRYFLIVRFHYNLRGLSTMLNPQVSGKIPWNQGQLMVCN